MKRIVLNLTYPQYRERNEIYEAIGYKQVCYVEKEKKIKVTYEVDDTDPHYRELRRYVRKLYSKGPSFYPIILMVIVTFVFLSIFVVFLIRDKKEFDLLTNALAYLLPAGFFLLLNVLYTFYYYNRMKRIILSRPTDKQMILIQINEIKNK